MAKILEKDIIKMMEALDISREEAVDMLMFDMGEAENEEVDTIEEKAKATGAGSGSEKPKPQTKKGSSLDKVKHQKAKKKADEVKDAILKTIKHMMVDHVGIFIKPQELTSTKTTFKACDGSYYSITLTKHKAKPDGYED